ncbi:MAG: YraN family protein, partial [Oscillospiraceae bacterium]|nr:YraN family protein [Oscillospiraceae bacterium]
MSAQNRGAWGEAQVAAYLRRRGWEIVAANYRCRFGEIDII